VTANGAEVVVEELDRWSCGGAATAACAPALLPADARRPRRARGVVLQFRRGRAARRLPPDPPRQGQGLLRRLPARVRRGRAVARGGPARRLHGRRGHARGPRIGRSARRGRRRVDQADRRVDRRRQPRVLRGARPARLDSFKGFRVYGRTEEKSFEKAHHGLRLGTHRRGRSTPFLPLRCASTTPSAGPTRRSRRRPSRSACARSRRGGPRRRAGQARRSPAATCATSTPGRSPGRAAGARARARARARCAARRAGGSGSSCARRCAAAAIPGAPLERRRRRARRKLARALAVAAGPADELRALATFLAERTREPEEAWIGRDVEAALRARLQR
jgi:hypothetical protein